MARGLITAVVTLLLTHAGCLGNQASDDDARSSADAPAPVPAFLYNCPPGGGRDNGFGVCTERFVSETESLQEPRLAIDPSNPDNLAIGLIGGQTIHAAGLAGSSLGVDVTRLEVIVSDDGGRSFRLASPPPPSFPGGGVEPRSMIDPDVAFDSAGRLHALSITGSLEAVREHRGDVYYASSSDLGTTWSEPTALTEGGQSSLGFLLATEDDVLLAAWRNLDPPGLEVAGSRDGGRTWMRFASDRETGRCGWHSPPVEVRGMVVAACQAPTPGSSGTEVLIFQLNRLETAVEILGHVPDMGSSNWEPMMAVDSLGTLAVASLSPGRFDVAFSSDGGRSWTSPWNLSAQLQVDDTFVQPPELHAMSGDPWGGVHIVLRGQSNGAAGQIVGVHVVLDGQGPAVVQENVLYSLDSAVDYDADLSGSPAPGVWPNELAGLAFSEAFGWTVWGEGGGIAYTRLVPQGDT